VRLWSQYRVTALSLAGKLLHFDMPSLRYACHTPWETVA
jgi:hypothetical protein